MLEPSSAAHHGARAPQARRKARQRLDEAADRMARALLKMATDDNVSETVKLRAITDALDRAGITAKTAVEIELSAKPFEQIIDSAAASLEIASRAAFRASIGQADDSDDHAHDPLADLHRADLAKATAQDHRRHARIRRDDPNVIDAESVEIVSDDIDYGQPIAPEPAPGGPAIDPLTGQPYAEPYNDGAVTLIDGVEIVAEMNRRHAERVQREHRETGHATVHSMRRALPRGRS
jgi:hypothetical protein